MIEQNESAALKSKLLTRIIIAIALILAAILVLTLIEHFSSSTPPQKVAPPVPPAPPPKAPPKPVLLPKPISAPQPASVPAATLPPAPVVSRPIETPPPPAVRNVAPEAKPKKKAVERKKAAAKAVARKKAGEKIARKRYEAKKAEVKGDFTLQFGVFSSSANSEKMIAMLKKKGLTPSIDYRVLAGSYPDKASAEKEKKALGGNLVAIAKGYTLQVGDFSSRKHADALVAELKKKGVNAVLEARIRAGRYRSRSAALAEARKLGIAAIAVRR